MFNSSLFKGYGDLLTYIRGRSEDAFVEFSEGSLMPKAVLD